MELAWKMLETARVMFEEDANAALELADVLETIGELNMEQSQFDTALSDYKSALKLLEENLEATDRRLASALYSISIANQMMEANDDALAANTRAIEICDARIAELKAGTARVSKGARENADEVVSPEAAIAELEQIMGVASDLKERQLELKELVSADNSTREALRRRSRRSAVQRPRVRRSRRRAPVSPLRRLRRAFPCKRRLFAAYYPRLFAASRSHRFKKRRRSAWSRSKRPRPLPLQRRRR